MAWQMVCEIVGHGESRWYARSRARLHGLLVLEVEAVAEAEEQHADGARAGGEDSSLKRAQDDGVVGRLQ